MTRPILATLVALPLLVSSLTSCGDPIDNYCSAVKQHQEHLTTTLGEGDTESLIKALPEFEDLQGQAPDDIKKDWTTIVDAVRGLQKALDAANVDPGDFKDGKPPKGLSEKHVKAIQDAATKVSSQKTQEASVRVQQEARDVCHTSLTL